MRKILSIAVPCYNVEKYLRRCLDSFSDPRLEEGLEVLIVNDGSTDQTAEMAQSYVDQCPQIFHLITKENGGHGSAVNTGIARACGKYFRIVDGDDWVHTENLVRLLEILKKTDADLVVDEKREVHMKTGETHFTPLPETIEKGRIFPFREICNLEHISDYIILHTMSVRTDLLRQKGIRLREHIFYVDFEYVVKTTCESRTVQFVDLEIYQYQVGNEAQSVDSRNYVRRYSHHDQMVKEVLHFSENPKFQGAIRKYLDTRIRLVIHSHYKISLIFNENRAEGLNQARSFHRYLKKHYPQYCKSTRKRYLQALILHFLRVDARRLDQIMGR
ncbi:MAG: glycosyltransferase [Clostridiales bacterium]|nr:glycosyltransferase [Clostridiales bacterium]